MSHAGSVLRWRRAARSSWSARDPGDPATGPRHGNRSLIHAADELLPALGDEWEIEVCESRPRTQAHPQTGKDIAIADTVLRARLKG